MRSTWTGRVLRGAVALLVAALMLFAPEAQADDLRRLYSQILRDPANIELNLRYAALAEERGETRKALAAYERVLDADPANAEAQSGLNRIIVQFTPVITRGRAEFGVRYESNARERPGGAGKQDDVAGFATLSISDERPLLSNVWRSTLSAYADVHADLSSIDYWRGIAHTGPVFDLGGGTTLHVAPGAGVSFLDADYFWSEAALKLTFENLFGVLDMFDIRAGYRDIDNSFSRTDGVALDLVARETFRGIFSNADAFVVQPFFRWRDASGNGANAAGLPTSFLMGDYVEFGSRLMYFINVDKDIRLGGRFTAFYRDYKQNITLGTTGREDYYISPQAEVLFRNLICDRCDVQLRYRFEQNFSNDGTQDFTNHSVIASGIRRF